MPDLVQVKSLARLEKDKDLLPWAKRLVEDLYLQLLGIADVIDTISGGGGGGAHALLSATHTDVVASAPVRGSLIVGNATPAWARLALGASGRFLRSNGTDAIWSTLARADLPVEIAYEDEINTFALPQIFQDYLEHVSIPTPADPAPGSVYFYINKTGTTVEVRSRFEDGSECIICTHALVALTADELPLNWVE